MRKIIKLKLENTNRIRTTEDSYCEIYSHDKNNGSFEFEILNDTLTTEQVIALFKFTESNKIWKTTGTVEGNKVNVTFDTTLITQNETVVCYLYLDEEQRTSDTYRFKFKVKVSEIDKMNRYEVKERFINNTVIVDRLDVVTKDELKEALKNVGGISTEGLLTEVKAEELYAKKSEAIDNTNFELVKNRVLALELKTDKDTVYDDSELKGRISVLEAREDKDTKYDDTNVRERLTALESKPNVDVNNLVTKDELASKNYLTEHQDTSNFALKSEIPQQYNDTEVKERLTTLENKPPVDLSNYATKEELRNVSGSQPLADNLVTKEELEAKHYISDVSNLATKEELQEVRNSQPTVDTSHLVTRDELESKGYLTTHQDLSEYAKKSELYNDSDLRNRVVTLETKEDKDTKYDDTEVKRRLTELENKPAVDTSVFVTDEKLSEKGYITQQNLDNYALKSELPTPYNDSLLNERVTALESKAIEGGAYDDSDLRNRVTTLENKPPLDTSEFVTNQTLESKGYIKDVSNLVTKDELEGKHYISDISNLVTKEELENKGYLKTHQNLDNVVTKEELATKGYITDVSNLVTKEELESKNYLITPYNDTPLKERVEVLENKVDKDTIYNDTELRNRVEVLENKPNVDLSNYVTSEQLENKHYLTQHQELSHLATTSDLEALRNIAVSKAELSKKLDTTEYNSFKDSVVTKTELAEKGYLTTHQDISNLATKQEVEDTYAKKTDLPTPYNDSALVQKIGQLEARVDNDTVYDDTPLKERLTALESRPSSQSEMRGVGMPNGVVEAPIGTTYVDTAKTNGALKWIKTTDGGNTGWKVAEGDTGWVLGWQEDKGNNTNRMYFRRKNDVVHVKFEPKINSSSISPETNLILEITGYDSDDTLSIDGFKPVDDIVQTIYKTSNEIYSNTASAENSEGAQGTGAVIIQYEYYSVEKSGLKLQIVTSDLGVEQNHVNPFSYLTEDEWPVQLP